MDLAGTVRELYALGPAEFIPARDRLAKAARSGGDGELAAVVKKLKKPSAGAWLTNMLALHRQADLLPVLELGAAMREAQDELDGDELRRLGRERNPVIGSALASARGLADQLGQQAGDAALSDLEQTLRAALNDTEAAAAVASGQLVRALSATGLGPVELDGALADPASVPPVPALPNHRLRPVAAAEPARPAPATKAPEDGKVVADQRERSQTDERAEKQAEERAQERAQERAARRDRAEQRVAQTQDAAETVDSELTEARAAVTRTAAEYERLAAKLSALREQVVTLDRQSKEARREHREAQKALRTLPR